MGLLLIAPPFIVTLEALYVLAGYASPETWRAPTLALLALQLLIGL